MKLSEASGKLSVFNNWKESSCLLCSKSDKKIIRLGIDDVTQPIAPSIIEATHKAVDGSCRDLHGGAIRSWLVSFSQRHCANIRIEAVM